MKISSIVAVLVALFYVTGVQAQTTLKLNGSTTVSNSIINPNKSDLEAKSGCKLAVTANGSGNGLTDLAKGKADMAMISAPLAEVAEKVNAKAAGTVDASQMQAVQVGEANVAFVVHSSNSVKKLTVAQLSDILTGKIKNWKEVGGNDAAIVVVITASGDGVRTVVEEKVTPKGATFAEGKREFPNTAQVIDVVAQMPAAIGAVGKASVKPSVAVVETDKAVAQPLILVTKGAPSADAQKLIDAAKAIGGK
ncbi:MAG: substrate-binding domain-containing protein [Verrucomicrobiota bacterium]